MSCTEARTVVVRSITTLTSIAGEMEDLSKGNAARTRSTVEMMFAPGLPEDDDQDRRFPLGEPNMPDVLQ